MVVKHGFPAIQLLVQLIKQSSSPLTRRILRYGEKYPSFKRYGLIVPGRYYWWLENYMKGVQEQKTVAMKTKGAKLKPKPVPTPKIKDLDEHVAMECGAKLMIEVHYL